MMKLVIILVILLMISTPAF
ncbi:MULTISPECIES: type I toxin-antitoxin system Ibs family toxin [Pseudocitrobacter]|uniref:Type I toxin-antitoxin system Ibs family toxin n=1 Tax=Pseudocitrobacter vendiensis TaxID=2488306 RepID=A0ABM9F9I6_9ENTR|nr:type I toxin-antitoxin system Ibs family toxin [Pseudocitrobacter sp. 73]CAH6637234.1 Type I toxin-antitoxin system Ibs family toxin [Pseudocitrobacter vendiensis]